jgi:hypothetical protein
MKVSIEIDLEKVKFDYEVGCSKSKAETPLSVNWLIAFTRILELAHSAWQKTIEDRVEELNK